MRKGESELDFIGHSIRITSSERGTSKDLGGPTLSNSSSKAKRVHDDDGSQIHSA